MFGASGNREWEVFDMGFTILLGDITTVKADAIVNAANETLLGGGGVDGAIHRAAGPGLLDECRQLGGCKTGEAKITKAYRLPAKYVIHTPGPIWRGGIRDEAKLLASCYHNALLLARDHDCETVAFPSISTGVYDYPLAQAADIAVREIKRFLRENALPKEVMMVCFDRVTQDAYERANEKSETEL